MEKSTSRVYQRLNLYMIHRNMHTLQESKYIILIMMNRVTVRVNSEVEKSEKSQLNGFPTQYYVWTCVQRIRSLKYVITIIPVGNKCVYYYSC